MKIKGFCCCWKILVICKGSHLFICRLQNTRLFTISVSRFGEISPLWPNVIKLWYFGKVHLLFGNLLNLLWQILYGFGQIFSDSNGQILCQKTIHLVTLRHTASHYVNELTKDCLSMAQVDRRWLEAPCFDYQCTFEARGPADRRGCRGRQSSFRKILTAAPWGSSGPWPWPSRTTFSRRSPCRSLLEVHCKCKDQYVTKNVITRVGKWLAYQRWRSHTSSPIEGWPQLGTAM